MAPDISKVDTDRHLNPGLSVWNFRDEVLRRVFHGNSLSDPKDLLIPFLGTDPVEMNQPRSMSALPCWRQSRATSGLPVIREELAGAGIADRFRYASVLFLSLRRINLCASGFVRQFGRFDFDDRDDRQMLRATDTPL